MRGSRDGRDPLPLDVSPAWEPLSSPGGATSAAGASPSREFYTRGCGGGGGGSGEKSAWQIIYQKAGARSIRRVKF